MYDTEWSREYLESDQKPIAIEQLRLTRDLSNDNDYTVVEVQVNGRWYRVIRETFDNFYDHYITSDGIREVIKRKDCN